jgi:polyisoprenoid-binding protein YceI
MTYSRKFIVLLVSFLGMTIQENFAQTIYKQTSDSYLSISGTSTLHEWTMTSMEGKVQANVEAKADGSPIKFNSLNLSVRSESLKSGHNAMDKNAYSSLSTETHKVIKFDMTSASVTGTKVHCTGNLTVAGVTKSITLEAVCTVMPNRSLLCSGTKKLKMSDHEIEAPTFMFGTVTTGDEITISFNVNLAPQKK